MNTVKNLDTFMDISKPDGSRLVISAMICLQQAFAELAKPVGLNAAPVITDFYLNGIII
ncbi:hypothetical protein M5W70_17550 [Paenibacillus larvae]|nr:hypothetical protein [Paenibacillus larvae]MCY9690431.1 hypothetical protein [Paenibacillus larvae]